MSPAYEQGIEVAGYRLAERIGSGGMGEVYKAYNSSLNRLAAVKILHQASFADRFKNEAYIQSSVNHPNIARLYEYTSCGEKHCIVMEYVEGECLDALLYRKGKLSNEETENIVRQIVSALVYLHKKGIMHRDVKPQNFKVQSDGTVKMLDFGIAKHKYSPKLTQVGFVIGTTEYLAPEQFQQQAEIKSDVWALAVMTYQLLTGYMPFESSNQAALQAKIKKGSYTNPAILLPGISQKLLTIIIRSLVVNTSNRITAAGIENLLDETKQTNGPVYKNFELPSNKLLLRVGAVAAIVIVGLLIFINSGADIDEVQGELIQTNNDPAKKESIIAAPQNRVMINTPGIENAEIVLSDGARKPLPCAVEGKDGERFEFTIHAEGYKDKKVEVQITPRRSSFEYNLEKN
ncbi:MAG: serine/threonine-protein kinase [Ferruginibacter sp.]